MSKKNRNKQAMPQEDVLEVLETADLPVEVMVEEAAPKLDFDGWYAARAARIPRHHHKEILRADFSARGLGQCESMADFDRALTQYGVKLS